eukprot:TRINITY_DN20598_c0_g1_i3.p1 TRINITY_DN20598_c0_g1~~TRINITY_DN20598_c0_g1_i3.p1  ORF type:complete len:520 (+),score=66.27 TRINITY_DN20598_c0_g1_i3:184-1743(+)
MSDQWVGNNHPDPGFEQLACLQQALRNLLDGSAEVAMNYFDGLFTAADLRVTAADLLAKPLFIWYDYFAIPQIAAREENQDVGQDLGKAVDSIPAYIEMSEFFFIVAPLCKHSDRPEEDLNYQTWRERGWCRAERAARMLVLSQKRMTVVSSPQHLQAVDSLESYLVSVGAGRFTVESDKARIAPFVQAMLRKKLETISDKRSHEFRLLSCLRFVMLKGLTVQSGHHFGKCWEGVEDFLAELGFSDVCTQGDVWTPLCYAALTGDCKLIQLLLDAKADPSAGIPDGESCLALSKGALASDICSVLCHNDALEVLLEVQARSGGGLSEAYLKSALFNCAYVDNGRGIKALQKFGGDITVKNGVGASLVSVATMRGCHSVVEELLRSPGGSELCENSMLSPLHVASFAPGTAALVRDLLNAKADVNKSDHWPDVPEDHHRRKRSKSFADGQSKDVLCRLCHHWEGATPLIMCVTAGKLDAVDLLLAAKADTTISNRHGQTALDIALALDFPASVVKKLRHS